MLPTFLNFRDAWPTVILMRSDAANGNEAIQLWIETAEEDGRSVPEARGRRLVYA